MTFDPEPYLGVVLGTQHGLLEVAEYIGPQGHHHFFSLHCLNNECGKSFQLNGHKILHHRYSGPAGGRSTAYCTHCRRAQRGET